MATESNVQVISVEAASDLSSGQNRFVTLNSSGQIALSAAAARSIGVLTDKPDAQGKVGRVVVGGIVPVTAGASVTAGDIVQATTDGKVITQTSTNPRLGIAMNSAASGELCEVLFQPMG